MVIANTAATLSTVFAAIAAGAALAAIYLAAQTVKESRKASKEASAAHEAALAEQKELFQATNAGRREAVEAATHAFNRDLIAERMQTLSRIADRLREIADVARDERGPRPDLLTWSSIPGIATHLEVEIALYRALRGLGSEDLISFASRAKHRGAARETIVGEAIDELAKLSALIAVERDQLAKQVDARNQMIDDMLDTI
jgi:hypothetical protein